MKVFNFFKNIEFDKKIKLIELIFLLLGILVVFIQLRESNRITWLQAIEERALEFSKLEVTDEVLQCLYTFENTEINKECTIILDKIDNQRKSIVYLDDVLDFFIEVIKYDEEYSIPLVVEENEFYEHYSGWFCELFSLSNVKKFWEDDLSRKKVNYIRKHLRKKSLFLVKNRRECKMPCLIYYNEDEFTTLSFFDKIKNHFNEFKRGSVFLKYSEKCKKIN